MERASASQGLADCDLVMKGGITSGVIYPRLVARLASRFRFHSIGGSSAGAIAAAGAAAAQLGVLAKTNPRSFDTLAKLPDELGEPVASGGSMLLNLFQPAVALRPHFSVLGAALNRSGVLARLYYACTSLLTRFLPWTLVGTAIGAMALVACVALLRAPGTSGLLLFVAVAGCCVAAVLTVALALAFAGAGFLTSFARELPRNRFGLCSGNQVAAGTGAPLALTPWLTRYFNQLAGKSGAHPLTFGELWAGQLRVDAKPLAQPDSRAIDLQMLTSALNLGYPLRVPFERKDLYYDEAEFADLFPPAVVEWMRDHARKSETAQHVSAATGRTFRALPEAADLPVVFGVRLSLSFPILLSAVPLYVVDFSLSRNQPAATTARERAGAGAATTTRFTRVWFSDGGIGSNFPVYLFDSPLPRWPTFGVNLRDFHPEHSNPKTDRAWLPSALKNNQGIRTFVPEIKDAPGLASIVRFVFSIIDTMHGWRDALQIALPGFRDRVVHVAQGAKEGGLNLDMPKTHIDALAEGGQMAADKLMQAFLAEPTAEAPHNAWDNHRRIRVRNALARLQEVAGQVRRGMKASLVPTYEDVTRDPHPPCYPFKEGPATVADDAVAFLRAIEAAADALDTSKDDFSTDAPLPAAELRMSPRV